MKLLLKRGANVNLVNEDGNTALHLATHGGFDTVVVTGLDDTQADALRLGGMTVLTA